MDYPQPLRWFRAGQPRTRLLLGRKPYFIGSSATTVSLNSLEYRCTFFGPALATSAPDFC